MGGRFTDHGCLVGFLRWPEVVGVVLTLSVADIAASDAAEGGLGDVVVDLWVFSGSRSFSRNGWSLTF